MAGVLVVVFWIVFLSGVIALAIRQSRRRRRAVDNTSVLTRYTEQQIVQAIESAFNQGIKSLGWKSGPGEGQINKIHRNHGNSLFWNIFCFFIVRDYETVKLATTLSIDITPEPNGVTRIDMWVSSYTKASISGSVGAILRVKQRIADALAEPDTPQLAQQMYGAQANAPLDQPYQQQRYDQ